jgi:hypothetical protein
LISSLPDSTIASRVTDMKALRIGVLISSVCVGSAAAAGGDASAEGLCSAIANDLSGGTRTVPMPSLHVIQATAVSGPFMLPPDAPASVKGISCVRATLLPEINDYKVLLAGLSFTIVTGSGDSTRQISLEVQAGRIQVQYPDKLFGKQDERTLQLRLNELQSHFNAGE